MEKLGKNYRSLPVLPCCTDWRELTHACVKLLRELTHAVTCSCVT